MPYLVAPFLISIVLLNVKSIRWIHIGRLLAVFTVIALLYTNGAGAAGLAVGLLLACAGRYQKQWCSQVTSHNREVSADEQEPHSDNSHR